MTVFVIDLGSQYTHVIWRTVRDLGFKVEIKQKDIGLDDIENADAIILSGGPGTAHKDNLGIAQTIVEKTKNGKLDVPLLGVCLGHQLIAHVFGGVVKKGEHGEYGIMKINVDVDGGLFEGVPKEFNAWVSHFDEVKSTPAGFIGLAHSNVCKFEAIKHEKKNIFGVQFHPEVWHTEHGEKILANFLKTIKKDRT